MCPLAQHSCWRACCQAGLWGGGAPDAGSGPSPRVFPHGGADACTPRQGVTLLYGPSICTRSVQMDLRRIQVRLPFPTPGSGTLWVSGESLRDRHVSCLPRWTVCPTRSPSQDTNRSTCRGECSWSGPLATPPGRCHLGPLANGPGRNPPYCSRSDGADTDTGGAPKPQRSGTSPALFAGSSHPAPPPLAPASQLSSPGALSRAPCCAPWLPPCPVCPCCLSLLWRVGVLGCSLCFLFFFFFFSFCPPPCPLAVSSPSSPFLRVGVGEGGGGGGILAVLPFVQARRKHGAGTRHGTCPSAGGGGGLPCGSRRHPTLPAVAPPAVPPWGLARRVFPLGTVVSPLCLPTLPRCPRGRVRRTLSSSLLPPRLLPVALASVLGGCGRWGRGGGGGRPRCPSSGVGTSQARYWHVARHLSSCWGVEHATWPLSSPCPRCVRPPGAPPAGEGGPLPAAPFLLPPPLGGRRHVGGGGGLVVFLPLPSRRWHEAWPPSLCRGGGFASRLPSSPLLSYARTPGGPPVGVKVLPWVDVGAGGLGAGKTSGAGTRGVSLDVVIGVGTRDTDTNGGESSDNRSKIHADCGPAENPSL